MVENLFLDGCVSKITGRGDPGDTRPMKTRHIRCSRQPSVSMEHRTSFRKNKGTVVSIKVTENNLLTNLDSLNEKSLPKIEQRYRQSWPFWKRCIRTLLWSYPPRLRSQGTRHYTGFQGRHTRSPVTEKWRTLKMSKSQSKEVLFPLVTFRGMLLT